MEILYDDTQTAAYLGGSKPLSTRTLARWRSEETGPPYCRIGRMVRYRQSDLDKFLKNNSGISRADFRRHYNKTPKHKGDGSRVIDAGAA